MRTNQLRQLNFRHLHYFWVVARDGHLTNAAQRLHVSQSALSSQIKRLEQRLGQALFLRENRSLRLTEFGALVLSYADSIFALGDELLATASGEAPTTQRLSVGAVATLSRNFQENFLRPVIADANVRLSLESGGLDDLLARLQLFRLDLVLSNHAPPPGMEHAWRCRRISRQSVCLVGPPRRSRTPFRFKTDVASVDLLLPGRSSGVRSAFELRCEDLGIQARVRAEVDDMALLRLLARDSGAVAVVPEVVVQDELRSGTLVKYCAVPEVYENFYAITIARHYQPEALTRLLKKSGPATKPAKRR